MRRRSTESYGVGQSGYTAGRREHDPALERDVQVRYQHWPRNTEDDPWHDQLDTDDRFTGRGGAVPSDEEGDPRKVPARRPQKSN
jgi:hypothetical protein